MQASGYDLTLSQPSLIKPRLAPPDSSLDQLKHLKYREEKSPLENYIENLCVKDLGPSKSNERMLTRTRKTSSVFSRSKNPARDIEDFSLPIRQRRPGVAVDAVQSKHSHASSRYVQPLQLRRLYPLSLDILEMATRYYRRESLILRHSNFALPDLYKETKRDVAVRRTEFVYSFTL